MVLEEGGTATVKDGKIIIDLSECDLSEGDFYLTKTDLIDLTELLA